MIARLAVSLALLWPASAAARPTLRVAAKPFAESYLLSEMVAQIAEAEGEAEVRRVFGLGGPNLVVEALRTDNVDVDVAYTGDLARLLLGEKATDGPDALRPRLAGAGVIIGGSLGFANTYALAVRADTARDLGLAAIGDLRRHPELRGGFGPDFLNHRDGLYRLQEVYGLELASITALDHALAYEALGSGRIDVTDAYTTDGRLPEYDLVLLRDDLDVLPKYDAVVAARADVPTRLPRTWAALRRLEGRFDASTMIWLNSQVERGRAAPAEVAGAYLRAHGLVADAGPRPSGALLDAGLWTATREHFNLVVVALALSCLLGVPIGIVAFLHRRFGGALIAISGLLQTIPALALLCFFIPLLGIGVLPTVCALFLYGLLPIVQGTAAGLLSLDRRVSETARILGLGRAQRLRLIELPLASRSIIAGIETTAVINVATATIAAGIGAGGYGGYIVAGMAMNDDATILKGAVPSAIMAAGFHGLFELLQRLVVPRGLRIAPGEED